MEVKTYLGQILAPKNVKKLHLDPDPNCFQTVARNSDFVGLHVSSLSYCSL